MKKANNPGDRVLARALAKELKHASGGDVIVTAPPGRNRDITQVSAGDVPAD